MTQRRHIVERPAGAWVDEGACVGRPGDLWFADSDRHVAEAKAICKQQCPVIAECLQWAVETREGWGVWGGHTPQERANLARRVDYQVKKKPSAPVVPRAAGPRLPDLRVLEGLQQEADEVAERFRKHRADNTPLMTAARTAI